MVVVYKVDQLTRSLMDFAKIVESFDTRGVSFVSITQQFNTASSMGQLMRLSSKFLRRPHRPKAKQRQQNGDQRLGAGQLR